MPSDLDALRNTARAVSAHMVATELAHGTRTRTPADPGGRYVEAVFAVLLVAADLGLIETTRAAQATTTEETA